ncbi:MAG: tetratricopeptide repeat protein [Robiginitomaculum sp.]|nr:tetratricopeptide repeat protein [Robiginitomaculum sp.]
MRPYFLLLLAGLVAPVALSGCTTPISEEEASLTNSMVRQIQPQTRAARDAIEQQDVLTRSAFWAAEYENNPADREAALKLARLVRTIGNPGRAATIGSQSLALFPNDRDLLLITAQSLIEDGNATNAISFLQSALKQDPLDVAVLSALGVAYDQSDRHELAMQTFNKALALSPDNSKLLSNIGLSYALQGDPVTAEAWLLRATAQPDADARVRQNLALVLGLQGRFIEAEAMASKDMPNGIAKENINYVKSMITRPQAWEALRGD